MAAEQAVESIEATEVVPGDLTAILKHHREEHGLNINQVAEALCLSPKIITALEAENLDELPEPPYVRGYLRSFAKFVEVEPTEIIGVYEKLRGAKPDDLDYHFAAMPSTKQKKKGLSAEMIKAGLLILLIGLLAILSMIPGVRDWVGNTWSSFSQKSEPSIASTAQNENPLLTGNIPAPLPIDAEGNSVGESPVEGEGASTSTGGDSMDSAASTTSEAGTAGDASETSSDAAQNTDSSGVASTEGTPETDAVPPIAENETEVEPPPVPEGSSALKLEFTDEVWMRIRDPQQKKLFEALSQKGDSKELVLPRPMVFRVGNAPSLSLTVDGKLFDMTPFTRNGVATFTIE